MLTWFDWLIVFLGCFLGWIGFRRGFAREFSELIAGATGLWAGLVSAPPVANALVSWSGLPKNLALGGIAITIAIATSSIVIALGQVIARISPPGSQTWQAWGGLTVGLCKAFLIAAVLVLLLDRSPFLSFQPILQASPITHTLLHALPYVGSMVDHVFGPLLNL